MLFIGHHTREVEWKLDFLGWHTSGIKLGDWSRDGSRIVLHWKVPPTPAGEWTGTFTGELSEAQTIIEGTVILSTGKKGTWWANKKQNDR